MPTIGGLSFSKIGLQKIFSGKTASIVPTPRPKSSFINLPPITQSTGTPTMGSNAGTHVPSFPAVSASGGSDRSTNASIYGII